MAVIQAQTRVVYSYPSMYMYDQCVDVLSIQVADAVIIVNEQWCLICTVM